LNLTLPDEPPKVYNSAGHEVDLSTPTRTRNFIKDEYGLLMPTKRVNLKTIESSGKQPSNINLVSNKRNINVKAALKNHIHLKLQKID